MPRRVRQRIVFCDCLDCQELAPGLDNFDWEAAAKQLPPPRSLMLLLEGFNHSVSSDVSDECCSLDRFVLPHFDNVARQGVTFCAAQPKGEKLFSSVIADKVSYVLAQSMQLCKFVRVSIGAQT
jgi:hypothetical protein